MKKKPSKPKPKPKPQEEEEAYYGGEFHRWSCPRCEEVNECEGDPRGQDVECLCGWKGKVSS